MPFDGRDDDDDDEDALGECTIYAFGRAEATTNE